MVSAIKVQMKFDMDYNDFFSGNYQESFAGGVADFLGISMDRIRIVNIRSGSTIIDYYIMPEETVDPNNLEADQTQSLDDLVLI